MGLAQYQILPQGDEWGILHDGDVKNTYATKEAAFEAAVAAASLAVREGHEVHISVPDRSSGNQTALGAKGSPGNANAVHRPLSSGLTPNRSAPAWPNRTKVPLHGVQASRVR